MGEGKVLEGEEGEARGRRRYDVSSSRDAAHPHLAFKASPSTWRLPCLAALLCWSQIGCALFPARTGRGTYSVQDMLARDGLLAAGDPNTKIGRRTVGQWLWAELNGRAPQELVLRVDEYLGEARMAQEFHVYSIRDPRRPRRLGAPAIVRLHLESPHDGYALARDVDLDGRQELFIVGDTDGAAPSNLHIFTWLGDRFEDRVWGDHPGTTYFWFDHDQDRTPELVALRRRGAHTDVTLLTWSKGHWRPMIQRRPLAQWLPRAWDHVVRFDPLKRPQVLLPALAAALQERGLGPHDLDGTQDVLARRVARAEKEPQRAAFLAAMSWPGSTQALDLALELMTLAPANATEVAATALLARRGEELHRALVIERVRAAFLHPEHPLDGPLFSEVFAAFDARRGGAFDARPYEALEALLQDQRIVRGRRMDALTTICVPHPGFAASLMRLVNNPRDPTLHLPVARALALALAPESPQHASWRARVSPAELTRHLHHPNAQVRAALAQALSYVAPPSAAPDLLSRFWLETDPLAKAALLDAVTSSQGEQPEFARMALLLPNAPGLVRAALHRWVARHAPEDRWRHALAHIQTAQDLAPYTQRARSRDPSAAAPPACVAALQAALQHPKDHELRLHAARVARFVPQTSGVLRARLSTEPDVTIRAAIVDSLAGMRDPASLDVFLALLQARPDTELHAPLIDALGHYTAPRGALELRAQLQGSPANIIRAARVLSRTYAGATPELRRAFLDLTRRPGEACKDLGGLLQVLFEFDHPRATDWLAHSQALLPCAHHKNALTIQALQGASRARSPAWARSMVTSPHRDVRIAATLASAAHQKP